MEVGGPFVVVPERDLIYSVLFCDICVSSCKKLKRKKVFFLVSGTVVGSSSDFVKICRGRSVWEAAFMKGWGIALACRFYQKGMMKRAAVDHRRFRKLSKWTSCSSLNSKLILTAQ